MKPQDKKILIGGGIGIAALAYFTRHQWNAQGGSVEHHARKQHDHHKHGGEHNDRGEYGKKKHHHHED